MADYSYSHRQTAVLDFPTGYCRSLSRDTGLCAHDQTGLPQWHACYPRFCKKHPSAFLDWHTRHTHYSYEHKVGYPIICTNTILNVILSIDKPTMPGTTMIIRELRRHILCWFLIVALLYKLNNCEDCIFTSPFSAGQGNFNLRTHHKNIFLWINYFFQSEIGNQGMT